MVFKRRVGTVHAVDGVSFEIDRQETLGLVGESGSGKTTLGRTLIRLYRPTEGSIRLDGVDLGLAEGTELRRARRRIQMIFQYPYSSLPPRTRIGNIVTEPLVIHRIGTRAERLTRVAELLTLVGCAQRTRCAIRVSSAAASASEWASPGHWHSNLTWWSRTSP